MAFALILLLLFVPLIIVSVGATVWWLIVLIEAVKVPDPAWKAAGQDKLLYVLLMIFLGVVGTLIYVVVARPPLRAVGALA